MQILLRYKPALAVNEIDSYAVFNWQRHSNVIIVGLSLWIEIKPSRINVFSLSFLRLDKEHWKDRKQWKGVSCYFFHSVKRFFTVMVMNFVIKSSNFISIWNKTILFTYIIDYRITFQVSHRFFIFQTFARLTSFLLCHCSYIRWVTFGLFFIFYSLFLYYKWAPS